MGWANPAPLPRGGQGLSRAFPVAEPQGTAPREGPPHLRCLHSRSPTSPVPASKPRCLQAVYTPQGAQGPQQWPATLTSGGRQGHCRQAGGSVPSLLST